MLGSILSDILFVLGGCLFTSAWRDPILKLNTAVSGALSSLMIITAVALILPTAFYSTVEATSSDPQHLEPQILAFSRGTAFVLLVLYIAYLHFEFTRKDLFDPQPLGTVRRHDSSASGTSPTHPHDPQSPHDNEEEDGEEEEEEEEEEPANLTTTFAILLTSAAGIMFCSHFLLDTINSTSEATHISRTFIATILIPIASNAPECATVIGCSRNGRIDFAVAVIVSSILQIALFVVPVLVLLGWTIGREMTLNFETFQTVILFLAIILVNHLLQNGKYTYMHGLTLIAL
jgi:Ca2+:H+ antiporter